LNTVTSIAAILSVIADESPEHGYPPARMRVPSTALSLVWLRKARR